MMKGFWSGSVSTRRNRHWLRKDESSSHDGLPWFDVRKIPDVATSDIARTLIARAVPGVDHTMGRRALLDVYVGMSAFAVAIGGKADMGCCTAYVCF
jgi:hypothetical protein